MNSKLRKALSPGGGMGKVGRQIVVHFLVGVKKKIQMRLGLFRSSKSSINNT